MCDIWDIRYVVIARHELSVFRMDYGGNSTFLEIDLTLDDSTKPFSKNVCTKCQTVIEGDWPAVLAHVRPMDESFPI